MHWNPVSLIFHSQTDTNRFLGFQNLDISKLLPLFLCFFLYLMGLFLVMSICCLCRTFTRVRTGSWEIPSKARYLL